MLTYNNCDGVDYFAIHRTDFVFYAVDKITNRIVEGEDVIRLNKQNIN